MERIEAIRLGGVLESSFGAYPLPDLLIGILRGNLTGVLEVALSSERANFIYFRDGVPVSVTVPDVDVSLADILVDHGELDAGKGRELERQGKSTGDSLSAIVSRNRLVPDGALREAVRIRSRSQMVKLFDAGDVGFRFTEGAALPADAELAILQPLPVVYEGLRNAKDQAVVGKFLAKNGQSRFRLTDTYPRGVDPFEWGDAIEAAVAHLEGPLTIEQLVEKGCPEADAGAVLAMLALADMVEVLAPAPPAPRASSLRSAPPSPAPPRDPYVRGTSRAGEDNGTQRPPHPSSASLAAVTLTPVHQAAQGIPAPPPSLMPQPAAPVPPAPQVPGSSPGLAPLPPSQIPGLAPVPRDGGHPTPSSVAIPVVPPQPPPSSPQIQVQPTRAPADEAYEADRAGIARRLDPLRGKSYYEILRLSLTSNADQIERAYRYFLRNAEAQHGEAANRAWRDTIEEAHGTITDATLGPRYKDLCEKAPKKPKLLKDRQQMEAAPKIDRAVRAMAEGRLAEADYLLSWCAELDPERKDVRVHRAFLGYVRAAPSDREQVARALRPMIAQEALKASDDPYFGMYLAACAAQLGEHGLARDQLRGARDRTHPLVRAVERMVAPAPPPQSRG